MVAFSGQKAPKLALARDERQFRTQVGVEHGGFEPPTPCLPGTGRGPFRISIATLRDCTPSSACRRRTPAVGAIECLFAYHLARSLCADLEFLRRHSVCSWPNFAATEVSYVIKDGASEVTVTIHAKPCQLTVRVSIKNASGAVLFGCRRVLHGLTNGRLEKYRASFLPHRRAGGFA